MDNGLLACANKLGNDCATRLAVSGFNVLANDIGGIGNGKWPAIPKFIKFAAGLLTELFEESEADEFLRFSRFCSSRCWR